MVDKDSLKSQSRAILADAVERMSLRTKDAPFLFGVTPETFSHWLNARTRIPPWVFARLVEIENERNAIEIALEDNRRAIEIATERRNAEIIRRVAEMRAKK